MIIIAGTIDFDPEKREGVLLEARDLIEETREQGGCHHYVWSPDVCVDGRLYVYEAWEDTPSLAAHLKGPYYKSMLALIGRHAPRRVKVEKHRVDLSEPVYDPDGVPRADFFSKPL